MFSKMLNVRSFCDVNQATGFYMRETGKRKKESTPCIEVGNFWIVIVVSQRRSVVIDRPF